MDAQIHDDGAGAAVAGSLGGFVGWARSPDGWRKLLARVISGLCCGYLANAAMKYYYPDVPYDLRWGLSFIAGVVSAIAVDFALRAAGRLTAAADRQIDGRIGLPPRVAHDGQSAPATACPPTAAATVVEVRGAGDSLGNDGVVPHHGVVGQGPGGAGGE